MDKQSRKRQANGRKHPNGWGLRERHHNHTKRRARTRYGLKLNDGQLEELISLIQKGRKEKVRLVGNGSKKNGAFIYIVIFCGKAITVVYNPEKNWLVTCLKLEWAFKGLPPERVEELKGWLRERRMS